MSVLVALSKTQQTLNEQFPVKSSLKLFISKLHEALYLSLFTSFVMYQASGKFKPDFLSAFCIQQQNTTTTTKPKLQFV